MDHMHVFICVEVEYYKRTVNGLEMSFYWDGDTSPMGSFLRWLYRRNLKSNHSFNNECPSLWVTIVLIFWALEFYILYKLTKA